MSEKSIREDAASLGLGATGRFPQGKIDPNDEGELKLAVSNQDGNVIIAFGKPVHWVGLDKVTALQFAKAIFDHANALPKA